ncbi:MAG: diguanylate cyclase [Actinobacteria bacterium]|nr:diguanylate cyclase [Actinomycetota bacterium]
MIGRRNPAVSGVSWERAATRMRVLQIVQLSVLVVICAGITLMGILISRDLRELGASQDRINDAHSALTTAHADLLNLEVQFFRAKASNPDEKALTPTMVLLALSRIGVLTELTEADQMRVTPQADRAADVTASTLDALVSLVQANAQTPAGSAQDRAGVRKLGRLTQRANAAVNTWVHELRSGQAVESRRIAALQTQLTHQLWTGIGAMVFIALAIWLTLDRARGRVVAALRGATESQQVQGALFAAVAEGCDLATVCTMATRVLEERPHTVAAGIARWNDEGAPTTAATDDGAPPELEATLAHCIATGTDARATGEDGSTALASPILVDGTCWGALGVVARPGERPRAAAEAELRTLVPPLSVAISRLVDLDELNDRATTDALTGLLNHRVFHERLRDVQRRSEIEQSPVSVVVLDIDHFKSINDALGHQTGDEVLAEVARRLRSVARDGDTMARIGGEEFAWAMPDTNAEQALDAAERALQRIRENPVGPIPQVTMSAGVASTQDRAVQDDLLSRADFALYWAKSNGRNAACRWTPEVDRIVNAPDRSMRMAQLRALSAIQSLAHAVDARDPYTQRHSERVADLSHRLALEAGWSDDDAADLHQAALMHDVGKVGVPDAILLKKASLSDAEYEVVKTHAALGAQIVAGALSAEQVSWVRGHHERIDGRGYPDGLSGDAIPAGARIMAVADAWDAMTSNRPYRDGCSPDEAYAVCVAGRGEQLCADAVDALTRLRDAGLLRDSATLGAASSAPVSPVTRTALRAAPVTG